MFSKHIYKDERYIYAIQLIAMFKLVIETQLTQCVKEPTVIKIALPNFHFIIDIE